LRPKTPARALTVKRLHRQIFAGKGVLTSNFTDEASLPGLVRYVDLILFCGDRGNPRDSEYHRAKDRIDDLVSERSNAAQQHAWERQSPSSARGGLE